MNVGDNIKCIRSDGYNITIGKKYVVRKYEPGFFDTSVPAGYTWPAYVTVDNDSGRQITCHASRFVSFID